MVSSLRTLLWGRNPEYRSKECRHGVSAVVLGRCVRPSSNIWCVCTYSQDYLFFYLMIGQIYRMCFFMEKLKFKQLLRKKWVSERLWAKIKNPGWDILHMLGQNRKYVFTFWWKYQDLMWKVHYDRTPKRQWFTVQMRPRLIMINHC